MYWKFLFHTFTGMWKHWGTVIWYSTQLFKTTVHTLYMYLYTVYILHVFCWCRVPEWVYSDLENILSKLSHDTQTPTSRFCLDIRKNLARLLERESSTAGFCKVLWVLKNACSSTKISVSGSCIYAVYAALNTGSSQKHYSILSNSWTMNLIHDHLEQNSLSPLGEIDPGAILGQVTPETETSLLCAQHWGTVLCLYEYKGLVVWLTCLW